MDWWLSGWPSQPARVRELAFPGKVFCTRIRLASMFSRIWSIMYENVHTIYINLQCTIYSLRNRAHAMHCPSLDFVGLGGNRRGEAFMSYTARFWCEQAVFSKHPQQAEGCCNNRSSLVLVFLACQRSSKRPWSSASWRLVPCSAWQRFAVLITRESSSKFLHLSN